jgi:hypothetical protein
VIDGPPEGVTLAVDLHAHLVQVPTPEAGFLRSNPTLPVLGGDHRAETVPPEANSFVADVDAALVEQILHVAERKREPNVHRHRQADDLRASLELAERAAFCDLAMP